MRLTYCAILFIAPLTAAALPVDVRAQDSLSLSKDSCDPIGKVQFYQLARSFKTRMDRSEAFTDKDAITMIRIYNATFLTIIADDRSNARLVNGYREVFEKHYKPVLARKYKLGATKGMEYLIKLDFFLGVAAPARCRDSYLVEKVGHP